MSDVLSFDISKNPKGNPITYGRVGDTNGLTRKVKVYEDGKPLDLTGYVITFEGNTSKYKTKVFDTDGISIVDAAKGEFNYTFPNMAFAVEGQYERAYFSFANATKRLTTADFQVIVFGNSDIDAEEAETIITEYNKLVKELHEMQDQYIEETDQRFLVLNQQLDALHLQVDDLVARLDAGDFYTKAESDDKYSTKTESDLKYATKDNVYAKTESDERYAAKDRENDFSEDNIFQKNVNVNGKTTSQTMEVVEEFTAASITASGLITASAGIVDASGNSFVRENANMLIYREALINADWNTILTTGFYYVSDLSNQINKPPVITASGYLVIYNQLGSQLGEIIQEYHASNGDIAVRSYNSTSQSWGDWFGRLIRSIPTNTWDFGDSFTHYSTGSSQTRILSDGVSVTICGQAKNTVEIAANTMAPILLFPLSMKPAMQCGQMFGASGANMWQGRCPGYEGSVAGTTEFIFERHRGWQNNKFDYMACPTGGWLNINFDYLAAAPIPLKDMVR